MAGAFPGWRWYEEEQGTCQEDRLHLVHVWVKVARDVRTAEVHFKAKRGETNTIELTVRDDVVFDASMKLNSDVDGHECEWSVEEDEGRGDHRSVHVIMTRCKNMLHVTWSKFFRNDEIALSTTRRTVFGDSEEAVSFAAKMTAPAKKRRPKKTVVTVLEPDEQLVVEDITAMRCEAEEDRLAAFYGVPVCDSGGAWSVVSGTAAKFAHSSLVDCSVPLAAPVAAAAVPEDSAVCAAVQAARDDAAAATLQRPCASPPTPSTPPCDEPAPQPPDLDKVLFPTRLFDPFFQLGLTLDEQTCEVTGVKPGGQGDRLGVLVGWCAVAVGKTAAPLASLQHLVNELTTARQTKAKLPVLFEGDAQE